MLRDREKGHDGQPLDGHRVILRGEGGGASEGSGLSSDLRGGEGATHGAGDDDSLGE